jgi:[protein-PII] uridylyltransferase
MNSLIATHKKAISDSRDHLFSAQPGLLSPLQKVTSFAHDVDKALIDIFSSFIVSKTGDQPICLIALGGYGRAELCPASDIDLLILHDAKPSLAHIAVAIRCFWDIGLTMGCVVRTLDECAEILGEDIATDMAFLENRLLAGDINLHGRLERNVLAPFFAKKQNRYIKDIRTLLHEKLFSPENTIYHVEPDLKTGVCTLRDCQRLRWAQRLRANIVSMEELPAKSDFSITQTKQFISDYEFLLDVRCALHTLSGRRMDILEIGLQPEIAARCGFSEGGAGALMERFFKTVRSVRLFLLAYLEQGPSGASLWTSLRKKVGAVAAAPGIRVCEGIFFTENAAIERRVNPVWILLVFRQAMRFQATLSVELRNAIRLIVNALSPDDFKLQRVNELFREILSYEGNIGHVFQLMHETNVLSRIIPQFEELTCKVEYDSYHEYTIDQHLLMTLSDVEHLSRERDKALEKLYSDCSHKMILRLALLLHDIGKSPSAQHATGEGHPTSHAVSGAIIAEAVCEGLGLAEHEIRRVRLLIYHHLDLSDMSRREPGRRELAELARRIGDRTNLDMLYLLTIVDIRCVGRATWTAWKGYQLENLYSQLKLIFDGPPLQNDDSDIAGGRPTHDFSHSAQKTENETDETNYNFDIFPEDQKRHEMWLAALSPGELTVYCDEYSGFERLTICGWDRMGFLRDLIGCISSEGYNILSAHLFAMPKSKVLDIIYVTPPKFPSLPAALRINNILKKWDRIRQGTADSNVLITERQKSYPLKPLRSAPQTRPRIKFDTASSMTATIIEIKTADNFGLLHAIARSLNESGVNIQSAHLSTRGDLADDVLYVTDAYNKKIIDEEKLQTIGRDIVLALKPTKSTSTIAN